MILCNAADIATEKVPQEISLQSFLDASSVRTTYSFYVTDFPSVTGKRKRCGPSRPQGLTLSFLNL